MAESLAGCCAPRHTQIWWEGCGCTGPFFQTDTDFSGATAINPTAADKEEEEEEGGGWGSVLVGLSPALLEIAETHTHLSGRLWNRLKFFRLYYHKFYSVCRSVRAGFVRRLAGV